MKNCPARASNSSKLPAPPVHRDDIGAPPDDPVDDEAVAQGPVERQSDPELDDSESGHRRRVHQ